MTAVRWRWLGAAVYLAVVTTGIGVATQAQEVRALYAALEGTQVEHDARVTDYGQLLLERSTLTAFHNVEELALSELKMRFPEEAWRVAR